MNKTVTLIREMNKIEKELASARAGVLAIHTRDNEMVQLPGPFLYHNKNIFITLHEEDDLLEKLDYDSEASFAVIRVDEAKSKKKSEVKKVFKIVYITLNGHLKKSEDVKVFQILKDLFIDKYSAKKLTENQKVDQVFLMLDTSEIKAIEEVIE